jgi:hypothetical protein
MSSKELLLGQRSKALCVLHVTATKQDGDTAVHVCGCISANFHTRNTISMAGKIKNAIAERMCYSEWAQTANPWRKHTKPILKKCALYRANLLAEKELEHSFSRS